MKKILMMFALCLLMVSCGKEKEEEKTVETDTITVESPAPETIEVIETDSITVETVEVAKQTEEVEEE